MILHIIQGLAFSHVCTSNYGYFGNYTSCSYKIGRAVIDGRLAPDSEENLVWLLEIMFILFVKFIQTFKCIKLFCFVGTPLNFLVRAVCVCKKY